MPAPGPVHSVDFRRSRNRPLADACRPRTGFPGGMPDRTSSSTRPYDVASALVAVVGLYQGAVPLVVRGLFGGEQRFAPALRLPSPWWWIACLGIVALGLGLLAVIDHVRPERVPSPEEDATADDEAHDENAPDDRARHYDGLSAIVLLVGVYNGLAPFVSRLVFDGDLFLAFTLRLPDPWWWIASLAVLVLTVVLLAVIDRAKERPH